MGQIHEKKSRYQQILAMANHPGHFTGRNGIAVTEVGEGYAKGEMENTPATQSVLGGLHGGALSALADTVAAVAVVSLGGIAVTVHNTMEYLQGAGPGPVFCEARVRKAGKTITVCQAVITDSQGEEVAMGTFSFFMTGETLPF